MLPIVIVNPGSASGSTREKWASAASDLRAHFGPFNVAFTKAPGDGIELAKKAATSGRKLVIACGGDGTINEVANGILQSGTDAELGILPSGTGGDLRRSLGIPQETRAAARVLRTGTTRRMDVGKVNFSNHANEPESRYFLNISSVGLAASIIERVKSTPSLGWVPGSTVRGKAAFALSTLREIVGIETIRVRISIDDEPESRLETINLCVANARFFGGGMKIAPDAQIDDGLFDVVNIGDISTAKVILNSYTLYNGTHLSLEQVKSRRARKVTIAPDGTANVPIELDGELPGKLPAEFEIVPHALSVRTAS